MTTPTLPFPQLPTWKSIYDQTEAFWSKPINQMLTTEAYLATVGLMREQAASRHEATKELMETYWETMRLPTKSDHARLAGQVVALEAKVEHLGDRLDAMDAKLDAILAALKAPKNK